MLQNYKRHPSVSSFRMTLSRDEKVIYIRSNCLNVSTSQPVDYYRLLIVKGSFKYCSSPQGNPNISPQHPRVVDLIKILAPENNIINWTLEILLWGTTFSPCFQMKMKGLDQRSWPSSQPLHTQEQTVPVPTEADWLIKPIELHHPQKAEMDHWTQPSCPIILERLACHAVL